MTTTDCNTTNLIQLNGETRTPVTLNQSNWLIFECTLIISYKTISEAAVNSTPMVLEFWNHHWSSQVNVIPNVDREYFNQYPVYECCLGDTQRILYWKLSNVTDLCNISGIHCKFTWSPVVVPEILNWSNDIRIPHLIIAPCHSMIELLPIIPKNCNNKTMIVLQPRIWPHTSKMHFKKPRYQVSFNNEQQQPVLTSTLSVLLSTSSCLHSIDHEWISRINTYLSYLPTTITSVWLWLGIDRAINSPNDAQVIVALPEWDNVQQWYLKQLGFPSSDHGCFTLVAKSLIYIHHCENFAKECQQWLQEYINAKPVSSHANISMESSLLSAAQHAPLQLKQQDCTPPQLSVVIILDDSHDNYYFDKLWQLLEEQTFTDWECLVIDNATAQDDGVRWIPYLSSHQASRMRPLLTTFKDKQTTVHCRNLALLNVRTPFVMFYEQTVHSVATRFEEQWSAFHRPENINADVVLVNAIHAFCGQLDPNHTTHKYNSIARHCIAVNQAPNTAMYRISTCNTKRVFPFDESVAEDIRDLDRQVQLQLICVHLPQVLSFDTQG
jgi:hypothetical protein